MYESLKALRTKFNYSQNSVAKYLGISRQMYIKYEQGEVEPPVKIVSALSDLYKVPIDILIHGEIKTQVEYKKTEEKTLAVADPGVDYSMDQVYYNTVVGMFKKMVFAEQLKVFAELAGIVQSHSNEIADSMLETKKEKDPLEEIWNRAYEAKDKTTSWKWNREELYDREICKHRGE